MEPERITIHHVPPQSSTPCLSGIYALLCMSFLAIVDIRRLAEASCSLYYQAERLKLSAPALHFAELPPHIVTPIFSWIVELETQDGDLCLAGDPRVEVQYGIGVLMQLFDMTRISEFVNFVRRGDAYVDFFRGYDRKGPGLPG